MIGNTVYFTIGEEKLKGVVLDKIQVMHVEMHQITPGLPPVDYFGVIDSYLIQHASGKIFIIKPDFIDTVQLKP